MKFTNAEKLMLLLLCDIRDGNKECDTDLIRQSILTDNTWALGWELSGIPMDGEDTPSHVSETAEILEMYTAIESSYDRLSAEDKKKVDESDMGSSREFGGFDGNNEGEYLSAMAFLVVNMNRFTNLKGREHLNSHMPTLAGYRRMLTAYKSKRSSAPFGHESIVEILNARRHA